MRYALALAMALAIGVASMVPAAHASDKVDRPIYRDGHVVLQSAVPVNMGTESDSSTVAGPTQILSDPYQEQHYDNWGR